MCSWNKTKMSNPIAAVKNTIPRLKNIFVIPNSSAIQPPRMGPITNPTFKNIPQIPAISPFLCLYDKSTIRPFNAGRDNAHPADIKRANINTNIRFLQNEKNIRDIPMSTNPKNNTFFFPILSASTPEKKDKNIPGSEKQAIRKSPMLEGMLRTSGP